MLDVFQSTISPLLTMFLCIIIGYVLNKSKLLPENSDSVMSKLETLILVPALNLTTFINNCTVKSLVSYRYYILTSGVMIIIAVIIAYLLSNFFTKDKYQKNIYRYALTFGNFGFLGNAIVPIILGEKFLYPYLLFTLPISAVCYTWGVGIMIPKNGKKQNILKNLLNPSIISIVIGAILGFCGSSAYIPSFVQLTLSNLSACMGPIAMILTGFIVAKYNFIDLLKKPAVYVATLLRLIILPIVFITALYLLKVDNQIIVMSLFAFATPLGLNTIVFPAAYGQDTSTGSSMALISHTLSVITIPILYIAVKYLLAM